MTINPMMQQELKFLIEENEKLCKKINELKDKIKAVEKEKQEFEEKYNKELANRKHLYNLIK